MKKYIGLFIIFIFTITIFCLAYSFISNNEKNNVSNFTTTTKLTTKKNPDYSNGTSNNATTTRSITTKTTEPYTSNKSDKDVHVTDFKIKVIDKDKNPVANLKITISNITGDKYNYTPDLSFTNNEGIVTGAGNYKKYQVTIEDVSKEKVYNTFTSKFEIKRDNQTYTFVWPYETPTQRKSKCSNCINFAFKNGDKALANIHIELYVGHYETNERWTTNYPEKIDLGHTDENGKITWDSPMPGKYTIFSYISKGDDIKKVSKKIIVSDIPDTYSINFS